MVGRETARDRLPAEFDVDAVEQDDRRDQQLAAGHSRECAARIGFTGAGSRKVGHLTNHDTSVYLV
jgi:hypothetical protein